MTRACASWQAMSSRPEMVSSGRWGDTSLDEKRKALRMLGVRWRDGLGGALLSVLAVNRRPGRKPQIVP